MLLNGETITNNDRAIMSEQNKNEYLLLVRNNNWSKGLSIEEIQRVSSQMMNWFKGLALEGKAVGGSPLENASKIVSGKNGRVLTDGPFAESKEAIGGYIQIKAGTLDEAIAITQQCPTLAYGLTIEVRQVTAQCPISGELVPEVELAGANA
jgi:hypothetical protein